MKLVTVGTLLLAAVGAGCGDVSQGRSPVNVVITALEGARGDADDEFGNPALSDVITLVTSPAPCTDDSPCATIFNDLGRVTMTLVLRDPGVPGVTAAPTPLHQVTFSRYRVEYKRTDGRNTQGVDIPYAFDQGLTFTVPAEGSIEAPFELVRHSAKQEAPLKALQTSGEIISTMTDVTFYGRDQAGNDVTVKGTLAVNFGNFADPD
jgi:hypothetical protein